MDLTARSRWRRLAEVLALWGVWVGLGVGLKLDPNSYLLLGIPLAEAGLPVHRAQPMIMSSRSIRPSAKRVRLNRVKSSSELPLSIHSAIRSATAGAIMKPWPTKPDIWRKFEKPGVWPRIGEWSGVTS